MITRNPYYLRSNILSDASLECKDDDKRLIEILCKITASHEITIETSLLITQAKFSVYFFQTTRFRPINLGQL